MSAPAAPHPRILVLTAPSGSGKTTIAKRVLAAVPTMRFSVSVTTRTPRPGEIDGVNYHFLTPQAFRERLSADDLVEYEEVYPDLFYGTLKSEVDRATREAPLLLDIDVKGAMNVKRRFGADALVIFVQPPSLAALEARLRHRDTEEETRLQQRLERARLELTFAEACDATVVNDNLDVAVAETLGLVRTFLGQA